MQQVEKMQQVNHQMEDILWNGEQQFIQWDDLSFQQPESELLELDDNFLWLTDIVGDMSSKLNPYSTITDNKMNTVSMVESKTTKDMSKDNYIPQTPDKQVDLVTQADTPDSDTTKKHQAVKKKSKKSSPKSSTKNVTQSYFENQRWTLKETNCYGITLETDVYIRGESYCNWIPTKLYTSHKYHLKLSAIGCEKNMRASIHLKNARTRQPIPQQKKMIIPTNNTTMQPLLKETERGAKVGEMRFQLCCSSYKLPKGDKKVYFEIELTNTDGQRIVIESAPFEVFARKSDMEQLPSQPVRGIETDLTDNRAIKRKRANLSNYELNEAEQAFVNSL